MKIFGYRKILILLVSAGCLTGAFYFSVQALLEIDQGKATQLAGMFGGFCTAFGLLIQAVYSALKGSYQKDTALGVAQCKHGAPPEK